MTGARYLAEGTPMPVRAAPTGRPPLVTQTREGGRIIVAAASTEALALGITPGMSLTSARAQLPELIVRPADPTDDRADLTRLALLLARRWSPIVAIDGANGLLIDVTGVAHLHGGENAMASRLIRLLARHGFTAQVALADTVGAAHALARHGDGCCICPPGAHTGMLAPLPPVALRLEDATLDLLRTLGIDTIGQLAAMPRAPLARRFGDALVTRLDCALGHVPEPLVPIVPAEPICIAQRFAEPIATPEAIAHWLGMLVPRLAAALAAAGLGARRIEMVAERVDHVPQCIRIGLARPNRDPAHILKLLLRRIETIAPGYGIDALTLHVRAADPLGPQPFAERLDAEAAPDLAPLIDTLATRGARMWRAVPIESDVPERCVGRVTPLAPPPPIATIAADDVRRLDLRETRDPWHPRWPRPARLLRRPERVDHVVALLPDGAPKRFTWRGRAHQVVRADGPERIAGEWWRSTVERHAVRDYFRVEDEGGARYWLYRNSDLKWFLHGAFG